MKIRGKVKRLPSKLPVGAVVTYAVKAPVGSHWRPATCPEIDCSDWRDGWVTFLDVSIPEHAAALRDVRMRSGRTYRELASIPGPEGLGEIAIVHPRVALYFPPGQQCFKAHRIQLEREPVLIVRGGDWRADTGLIRRHVSRDNWVEDFALNQDKVARVVERG